MKLRQIRFQIVVACIFLATTTFAMIGANSTARSHARISFDASFDESTSSSPSNSESDSTPHSQTADSQPTPTKKISAYTLPSELYQKAHNLRRIYFRFLIISFLYGVVVLWLILRLKLAPKYRTWAEKITSGNFVQALIFAPLLILTIDVFELPTEIYQHWLSVSYGLSIQGWPSWFWDWTKGEFVTVIIATFLIWIFYVAVRKSPRRWWLAFWAVSLPIGLFLVFLQPLIVDPLFHKFEPLAQKDPALTIELEKLVQRAGENIPSERMFWMGASEKSTTLNAYVTGFGASKRIVVWDTTIKKMNTPQIVFVAGHEMGHYVLQHISKGLIAGALMLLVSLYLGFRCIGWVLSRWGATWEIRSLDDLASLPVFLLLFTIMAFAASPIISAASRYLEHQADQYGLEVTHELTPDSGQAAAQAFQALGEVGLSDPDPNPIDVFMFYDHPPIRDRVQFCLTYDPWSQGKKPEFAK